MTMLFGTEISEQSGMRRLVDESKIAYDPPEKGTFRFTTVIRGQATTFRDIPMNVYVFPRFYLDLFAKEIGMNSWEIKGLRKRELADTIIPLMPARVQSASVA